MPDQKDDPRVHQCYVVVNGEKKLVTKRRVSADELRKRRDAEIAEQFAAEDAANTPRVSNVAGPPAAPETVDVDEIRKTVKERKAERTAMKPTAEGKRREADLAATVENERERLANESVSGGE